MSARDDLRNKLFQALDGNLGSIDMATDAVMRLIYTVEATSDEIDMTAMGDVRLHVQRQHWLDARFFNGVEHFEKDRECPMCGREHR